MGLGRRHQIIKHAEFPKDPLHQPESPWLMVSHQALGSEVCAKCHNLTKSGPPSVAHFIKKWCCMLFRHVTRMDKNTAAHHALKLSSNAQWDAPPDPTWCHLWGFPRDLWSCRIESDLGLRHLTAVQ